MDNIKNEQIAFKEAIVVSLRPTEIKVAVKVVINRILNISVAFIYLFASQNR